MADQGDYTIARAVMLLRSSLGLSLAAVAARCPVSIPYIHKIETGAKNNPSREVIQALDKALNAGGVLLAFAFEGDPMKRRSLFVLLSATAAGGNEYLRLLDGIASPQPRRAGQSDVEAVAQAVEFCTSLDLKYGGAAAAGPAESVLSWAVRLLDCTMTSHIRQQLSSEVAALADRVAWANYDAGNDQTARGLYGLALRVSQDGADPNLTAHILLDASSRESHNGNHGEAAALLRPVLDGTRLLPAVRANVRLTFARHLANMGHSREAVGHVERGLGEVTRFDPGNVPPWSKGFLANPAHLGSVAARSYLFAGAHEQAITGFREAVSTLGESRARGRTHALSLLALAYLRGGYPEQASETALQLTRAPLRLQSIRVAGHMRTLSTELAHQGLSEEAHAVRVAANAVNPAVTV